MSPRAPAVSRLVLTYFTRTPGLRWFTFVGLATFVVSCAFSPYITTSLPLQIATFATPFLIFLGAGLMPSMVWRMSRSHAICVLPYGRLKLLLSALITVALVALPVPVLGTLALLATIPAEQIAVMSAGMLFKMAYLYGSLPFYAGALLTTTWLYFMLWSITRIGNVGGVVGAVVSLLVVIYAPSLRIASLDPLVSTALIQLATTWAVFAALLFYAPRFRMEGSLKSLWRKLPGVEATRRTAGHELELMLGTARPATLAAALCIPVAVQFAVGLEFPATWLFYLTLASCICGALACRAAIRARAVWLRTRWERERLFAQVETSFWKHNSLVLALLLILLVVFTLHYGLDRRFIVLGIPLLALGVASSTYMGLMMTRGMRWFDSTLALLLMAGVMSIAVLVIFRGQAAAQVIGWEVALAVVATVLRLEARRRWAHLDWTQCRPEIGAETRTFS